MKISVLCSDLDHPVYPYLRDWARRRAREHEIALETCSSNLHGGDILFLVSSHEMIGKSLRENYRKSLVLHASDLPRGRGWSPHIWAVLEGQRRISLSLLEAADPVDTGDIWKKTSFELEGHELYDEINAKLFQAEIDLMDYAIDSFTTVRPVRQTAADATYYRRRTPGDSKIDIDASIREQFALLRVADPNRYPAFFEKDGHVYEIILRKRSS
jgi:methionyl-tRNA formyltransferase